MRFIPQFSCWKQNRYSVFVIATCARTGVIRLYWCSPDGEITDLEPTCPMPDIRLYYPCKWQALPAILRANLRAKFEHELRYEMTADSLRNLQAQMEVN
jgi:hypothetical protein